MDNKREAQKAPIRSATTDAQHDNPLAVQKAAAQGRIDELAHGDTSRHSESGVWELRGLDDMMASTSQRSTALPTDKEQEDIEILNAMMGGGIDSTHALRLLRTHNGNVDKAASALLEGDSGGPSGGSFNTFLPNMDSTDVGTSGPRTPPPSKPERSPLIDLTAEDDDKELTAALRASLEEQLAPVNPNFGPSNRAPDPSWAMVSSNTAVGTGMSQDDQSLSRAIEASLTTYDTNDIYEELPMEEQIRKDGRPVALRASQGSLVYPGLIIQGLFFVPQIRHCISRWRPFIDDPDSSPENPVRLPMSGPSLIVWTLLETFANMDLALISNLNIDKALNAFIPEQWSSPLEKPGELAFRFYIQLAWTLEAVFNEDAATEVPQPKWPRLFHFRYGFNDEDLSNHPFDRNFDLSVVKVNVRGTEETNDLISCLASELSLHPWPIDGIMPRQQVIFETSQVVAFQLIRENLVHGPGEKQTFKYPKEVWLDQFMKENVEVANAKRKRREEVLREVEKLVERKNGLTRFEDKDVLASFRSSLYYYENIAEHNGDVERKVAINDTAMKLRKTLTRIENEIQNIDAEIIKLREEAENVFNCPELQKYKYDLRFVLVHDGLFGRNHLYSYVKSKGTWWKTMDHSVTEVFEDTVLNDPVGLHLGAGPCFLIYSSAVPEAEEDAASPWPEGVANDVKINNYMFLSQLQPEIAAQLADPDLLPAEPWVPPSPESSDYTMDSTSVEPALSREEPMDVVN